MELVFEIFLELYMELMMLIVPTKNVTKKYRVIATVIAITVLIILFALVIWGFCLIIDKKNMLGIIPIAFAAVLSLAQIIAGIALYNKNH